MSSRCPGATGIRQPEPELIDCPSCGEEVEMWTDEIKAICPNCKTTVTRQGAPSCVEWCKYAKQCVGEGVYNRYMQNRAMSVKQKLLTKIEEYFGEDKKRINHAKQVLHFAQELLKKEGDWHIVVPASILHDVGIKKAEEKYGSSASPYQEKEGPPVAKEVLLQIGLPKEDIDEICQIIAHHHSPHKVNTQNFKILYDADSMVNLKENSENKDQTKRAIDNIFLTAAGKDLAQKVCR